MTRSSLSISSSTVFKLGRPGSLLSSANTPIEADGASSIGATIRSSSSIVTTGSRWTMPVVKRRSNWARPEFTIRATREGPGGSIRCARKRASRSSRSRFSSSSTGHSSPASQSAILRSSSPVAWRNPRSERICAR